MSGIAIQPLQSVKARLGEVVKRAAVLNTTFNVTKTYLAQKRDSLAKTQAGIEDTQKVEELLKALLDILVTRQVKVIEEVVTDGFRSIFFDQDLSFKTEISQKYGKISIDFFIEQKSRDGVIIRGAPLESFGGGPASIASLLLRVLALKKTKNYPLILLDESLAAVADVYIDNTASFLKTLSEEMDVPLLLITHKAAYVDHSSLAYSGEEVTDGFEGRHLKLTKVHDVRSN